MSVLKNKKHDPLKRAKGRLIFAGFTIALVFAAIFFRLADLTLSPYFSASLKEQSLAAVDDGEDDQRADIIDRNGLLLASSVITSSLYADAFYIKNPKDVTAALSKIFPDLNKKELEDKLSSQKRFVWIKRQITPSQKYDVNRLGIPGLEFKDEYRRIYPQGNLFSHVLGYTNIDSVALSGLEKGANDLIIESKSPVQLTLDARIQHIVRDELSKAIEEFKAKAGAGIVMNAKTGEIISLVSLPDFDPHHPGGGKEDNKFNSATLGVFEMGSTFKIFSAAAGLEHSDLSLRTEIDCRTPLKYGRFTISDYHPEKRIMTVPEVFMHSSNIGHVKIAERVGTEKMKEFFKDLGLFKKLDLEIPELGQPLIPSPWREINTATASFGHGIAITPLHLVTGASSIVNGGLIVKPTLLKKSDVRMPSEHIISKENSRRISEMLRLTVLEGTGKKADAKGYLVGGKTGTSEKNSHGKYNKKSLMSSFLASFPTDNPEYIVYMMVDEPVGNQRSYNYATGGWVAAPAVKNIIQRMTSLLGIPPKTDQQIGSYDLSMSVNDVPRQKKKGNDIAAR